MKISPFSSGSSPVIVPQSSEKLSSEVTLSPEITSASTATPSLPPRQELRQYDQALFLAASIAHRIVSSAPSSPHQLDGRRVQALIEENKE